ncbi:MAG: hypothetical protein JRC77_11780 [Deltaproteobacteria bacterium]|nr:hypothetical protein [Deltaproteobacteria bacterium]
MGEPLLNLPNVVEAVRIFLDQKTFAIASKRINVSTSGVLSKIPALLESVPVNLALSLHATTDKVRDVLVPLNKKFPLASVMQELKNNPMITKRRPVFFEYTLLEGVNDSPEDASRLVRLLKKLPAKLNVIPVNPHPASAYKRPSEAVINRFMKELAKGNFPITLRKSRGSDIDAACGQLATRKQVDGLLELQ